MANLESTKDIIREIKEILEANSDISFVSTKKVCPLSQESNDTAIYISPATITTEPLFNSVGSSAYNRHMLVSLICNVDCADDELRVFDVADSIERSLLVDTQIWGKLIDRDIVTTEFDNQEHDKMRTVVIIVDVMFRLAC